MPPILHTTRRAGLVLALATLAACGDDRAPGTTGPSAPAARSAFSTTLSATGTALVFLPPLGPTVPVYTGIFDGGKSPVVEICRWTGSACSGAPVARYTLTSGTGGTPLRVVADQQHYRADWKAKDRVAGAVYRVRVLLGGAEVGAASTRVLRPGETEAQVVAAGFVPVSRSENFIIRFRLETGTQYLPGAPSDPAASAIPRRDFVPRADDYSTGHPSLPGAVLSHNTLVLAPKEGVTVGQLNALLAEIGAEIVGGIPGASGAAAGLLALRIPSGTHAAMQATLVALRNDARVGMAVQDARVGGDVVTAPPTDLPWTLRWELTPADANWGLEAIRAPQLWNLNAGVQGVLHEAGTSGPLVGVLDGGFLSGHPDLAYEANLTPGLVSRHGTVVAGIIGARFDNMKGIDGVNPFARMVVGAVYEDSAGPTHVARRTTSSMMLLWDLYRMLRDRPAIRVVNVSQGFNWYAASPPISMMDTTVQRIATAQGLAAVEMLRSLQAANGRLPVIVASAGNASDAGIGVQPAAYSSPLANAALVHGAAPVIVVEASGVAGPNAVARAPFSNFGGHVSAPGVEIMSTDSVAGRYHALNGTSFAAPHVAGVASYLYALHPGLPGPTLTHNPVLDVLIATGTPASGLPPHLDAFAAALRLDAVMGGDHVLRTMLDVDDGTLDGNTRVNADGTDYTTDLHGDGTVDMSDFRRWRDWYLAATKRPGVQLDGTPRHWKKDVNGNGAWAADGDDENLYPRGDFNGDGVLSATAKRSVPGVMGGAEVTDLEVLQRLFDDGPDGYAKQALPALLESADVTVVASSCLAKAGATSVRVRVYPSSGAVPLVGRAHDATSSTRVYTVAVADGAHTVLAEALDATGDVVGKSERELASLAPGADVKWTPECAETDAPEVPIVFGRGVDSVSMQIFASTYLPRNGEKRSDVTQLPTAAEQYAFTRSASVSDAVQFTDYVNNNGTINASASATVTASATAAADGLGRVSSIDLQMTGDASAEITTIGQMYGEVHAGGAVTANLGYQFVVNEAVSYTMSGTCGGGGNILLRKWTGFSWSMIGGPCYDDGSASGTLQPGRYMIFSYYTPSSTYDEALNVVCSKLGTMGGCWQGTNSGSRSWLRSAHISFGRAAATAAQP